MMHPESSRKYMQKHSVSRSAHRGKSVKSVRRSVLLQLVGESYLTMRLSAAPIGIDKGILSIQLTRSLAPFPISGPLEGQGGQGRRESDKKKKSM
jgi:hypothetical protein